MATSTGTGEATITFHNESWTAEGARMLLEVDEGWVGFRNDASWSWHEETYGVFSAICREREWHCNSKAACFAMLHALRTGAISMQLSKATRSSDGHSQWTLTEMRELGNHMRRVVDGKRPTAPWEVQMAMWVELMKDRDAKYGLKDRTVEDFARRAGKYVPDAILLQIDPSMTFGKTAPTKTTPNTTPTPVAQNTSKPATKIASNTTSKPVVQATSKPVTKPKTTPPKPTKTLAQTTPKPVAKTASNPVTKAVTKTTNKTTSMPVTKTTNKTTSMLVTKTTTKTTNTTQPVSKTPSKPLTSTMPEPVTKAASETTLAKTVVPVSKTASKPLTRTTSEPPTKAASKTTLAKTTRPAPKTASKPLAQTIPKPVVPKPVASTRRTRSSPNPEPEQRPIMVTRGQSAVTTDIYDSDDEPLVTLIRGRNSRKKTPTRTNTLSTRPMKRRRKKSVESDEDGSYHDPVSEDDDVLFGDDSFEPATESDPPTQEITSQGELLPQRLVERAAPVAHTASRLDSTEARPSLPQDLTKHTLSATGQSRVSLRKDRISKQASPRDDLSASRRPSTLDHEPDQRDSPREASPCENSTAKRNSPLEDPPVPRRSAPIDNEPIHQRSPRKDEAVQKRPVDPALPANGNQDGETPTRLPSRKYRRVRQAGRSDRIDTNGRASYTKTDAFRRLNPYDRPGKPWGEFVVEVILAERAARNEDELDYVQFVRGLYEI